MVWDGGIIPVLYGADSFGLFAIRKGQCREAEREIATNNRLLFNWLRIFKLRSCPKNKVSY